MDNPVIRPLNEPVMIETNDPDTVPDQPHSPPRASPDNGQNGQDMHRVPPLRIRRTGERWRISQNNQDMTDSVVENNDIEPPHVRPIVEPPRTRSYNTRYSTVTSQIFSDQTRYGRKVKPTNILNM